MAALLTEMKFKDLSSASVIELVSEVLGQTELFLKTEAVAGLVFASTGVAVLVGVIALIGRMVHAKHESCTNRFFTCLVRNMQLTASAKSLSQVHNKGSLSRLLGCSKGKVASTQGYTRALEVTTKARHWHAKARRCQTMESVCSCPVL